MHGVSADTLVWLASGLDSRCVKKQCGLVGLCFAGRMTFDLRLSRARTGVVAMRQLLIIGYYEIGEKKGVKKKIRKVGTIDGGPNGSDGSVCWSVVLVFWVVTDRLKKGLLNNHTILCDRTI